jgi:DNA-binding Lrp family transcriptional regulator
MPFQLDDYDIAILKELMRDGRKSFRQISRETGITTPTVRARLERLINVGFIKSVSPIFDFEIVDEHIFKSEVENKNKSHKGMENEEEKQSSLRYLPQKLRDAKSKIKRRMKLSRLRNL